MELGKPKPSAVMVYNTAWYVLRFRTPLLCALRDKGYQVYVIAPFDGAEEKLNELGFQVLPLTLSQHGMNPLREVFSLFSLAKQLRQVKPDLVLSYTVKCNLYCGFLSRLYRWKFLPSVVGLGRAFERTNLVARLLHHLLAFAFKRAGKVFFQNREDCDLFIQKGIIRPLQGVVTPGSGVNLDQLRPAYPVTENSATLGGMTPPSTVFIMFGRLIPAKGFDLFLEAADRIKRVRGAVVEFWIAGGLDGNDNSSKALLEKIQRYKEKGVVTYWGHTDSVLDLVRQASVVVLPSTYNEGVPRSLLEGMALGKPLITSDWKGCRDTINPVYRNGYVVTPRSVDSLTEAILNFLDLKDPERCEMGENSRKFAEERFSEEVVLAKYLSEA